MLKLPKREESPIFFCHKIKDGGFIVAIRTWTNFRPPKIRLHYSRLWQYRCHLHQYAVGTYLEAENKLVGHVLMEISFLIFTFLKAGSENKMQVKVTGSRRLENVLVVPGSFLAITTSRAIDTKFEEFVHWHGHIKGALIGMGALNRIGALINKTHSKEGGALIGRRALKRITTVTLVPGGA